MKDKQINLNYSFSMFSLIRRVLGVGVIIFLILMYTNNRFKLEEQLNLNKALIDTVQVWKGKDGLNRTKITALETRDTEDFIKLATKDSAIIALQQEVKDMKKFLKKQGSVTNFTSQTSVETEIPTEVIPNEIEPNFPIYKSMFDLDSWVFGEIKASKDSTNISLKVKNDYSLTIGLEPNGFLGLGEGIPFAQVKNHNPYSVTTDLKTYQVSLPETKWISIAPSLNVGYGIDGKVYTTLGISTQLNKFSIKF